MIENLENIRVQRLPSFSAKDVPVDLLRLDLLHPVVSGNKWFKLKYYIADALAQDKTTIATFGGAWSNHIVATAYATQRAGLRSVGFIRGEASATPSQTLLQAMEYGMEIRYVDRQYFRNSASIRDQYDRPGWFWVMEGGRGEAGARGAAEILQTADTSSYTDILCAVGTGTMLAGLARGAFSSQQVTGISVLKNNLGLENEVQELLAGAERQCTILHHYHFGGYAKHPPALIDFMNATWAAERVPTDLVYTSKLLFAAKDLVQQGHFKPGARILIVHSGGLQGNRSLPPGTLYFS